MKILVVDDEMHCREIVKIYLEESYPNVHEIHEANSVSSALSKIESVNPDVVFLDIQLGNQSGFDILNELENRFFQLVFTTAFDEYAVKAFNYAAMHYLLKPISREDIEDAMKRIAKKYDKEDELTNEQGFYLKTIDTSYQIHFAKLTHIVADGSYSSVYRLGEPKIFSSKKLSQIEPQLNDQFYRVHHSVIVNINFIESISDKKNCIYLINGMELPVSRRKKKGLVELLNKN
ncbi:MAG: response regulator transcription factor [Chitinophagales bacterium]